MTEEIKLDAPTLLSHAQWLAESLQGSIEGVMSRCGILLGAVGVEMSILPSVHGSGNLRIICAGFLAVAAVSLAVSMRPMKRRFPKTSDLREVYFQQRRADLTALVHMIGVENPKDAWMEQLQDELSRRVLWYRIAFWVFAFAQLPVVAMIWRIRNG